MIKLGIMAEDKTQKIQPAVQMPGLKKADKAPSGKPGFLSKFRKGGGKAPSGAQPALEAKKPVASKFGAFNAQKINLKFINQILIFVLVALVGLMIYVTFQKGPEISTVVAAVSKIKYLEVETKAVSPFQKLSYYLDQIKTVLGTGGRLCLRT